MVGCPPKDIPRGSEEVNDAVPIGEVEREVQNLKSEASQGLREGKLSSGSSPHTAQGSGLKTRGDRAPGTRTFE